MKELTPEQRVIEDWIEENREPYRDDGKYLVINADNFYAFLDGLFTANTAEDELHCAEHLHIGLTCDCEVCEKLYNQIALRKISQIFDDYYSDREIEYDKYIHLPDLIEYAEDWLQREDK